MVLSNVGYARYHRVTLLYSSSFYLTARTQLEPTIRTIKRTLFTTIMWTLAHSLSYCNPALKDALVSHCDSSHNRNFKAGFPVFPSPTSYYKDVRTYDIVVRPAIKIITENMRSS